MSKLASLGGNAVLVPLSLALLLGTHMGVPSVLRLVTSEYDRAGSELEKHQWQAYSVALLYTSLVAWVSGAELAATGLSPSPAAVLQLTPIQRATTCTMVAYLLYDTLGIWRSKQLAAKDATYKTQGSSAAGKLFHHALGFFSLLSCLITGHGGNVAMWVYFAELSTPFLSLRWLLLSAGSKGSALCKAVEVLFALTFTLCRVVSIPLLLRYLWRCRGAWTSPPASAPHFWYVLVTTCCFLGQNLFWFSHIVHMVRKAVGLAGGTKNKSEKKAD